MLLTAREVHNRGGTLKVISQFWSKRQRVGLWCESVPEFEYCFHLELDLDVVRFVTQPTTITYELDGVERRHTPDFEVECRGSCRLAYVNVKPESVASYHGFRAQADAITKALAKRHATHEVVTAERIAAAPRLPNLKLLYMHLDRVVTPSALTEVGKLMETHGMTTAAMVADSLRAHGDIGLVWALVAKGHLTADMNQLLSLNTRLSLGTEP